MTAALLFRWCVLSCWLLCCVAERQCGAEQERGASRNSWRSAPVPRGLPSCSSILRSPAYVVDLKRDLGRGNTSTAGWSAFDSWRRPHFMRRHGNDTVTVGSGIEIAAFDGYPGTVELPFAAFAERAASGWWRSKRQCSVVRVSTDPQWVGLTHLEPR